MGETINLDSPAGISANGKSTNIKANDLVEIANGILLDTRTDISKKNAIHVPIAQLSTLGAGVSSLIPALRTVTQMTTVNTQSLYRVANMGVSDTLKAARNGNFWGAFKTVEGTSKFAQLQAAGPISQTITTVMPIDPSTMVMAAALFFIEQKLDSFAEMEQQILSFLEFEKESEIEADVETLTSIISKYKNNWDNEHFITSNHKLVLDIERTARKNMNAYQKSVTAVLNSKRLVIAQSKITSTLKDLQKNFKYYRLSLYTFSMASFVEIMLSGNFSEENITNAKSEIENLSMVYRDIYGQCSLFLEKMCTSSLETNMLKGIGAASGAAGKFIGTLPVIKEGSVDEFLQNGCTQLKKAAVGIEKKVVESFAEISNPNTGVFTEKLKDLIQIYNHTNTIYFDDEQIYLVAD